MWQLNKKQKKTKNKKQKTKKHFHKSEQ